MKPSKQKILVVDDILDNIEILAGILRPKYDVKVAMNGVNALSLAESSSPPDLILLDVMMPEMDGYDVCRRLKQNPATQKIPVIFVTSRNDVVDEVGGLELGAVDYITKPIQPAIVIARVETHLELSSVTRELTLKNKLLQENVRRLEENISLLEQVEQIARHDLKSPLTVFMATPDILAAGGNLSPRQLEFLKILDGSALKMLRNRAKLT